MEILFDNPLANLYGPYFLLMYGLFIIVVAAAVWIAKRFADSSDRISPPSIPANIDPFEIAYLRGGANELARAAVFSLRQRGLVQIVSEGKKATISRTDVKPSNLNQVETDVLNWIGTGREPGEFFSGGGLVGDLARHAEAYQSRLERQQMINGRAQKAGFAPVKWAAALAVLGFGGYKAAAALLHGRSNILFLVIIGVIGVVAVFAAGNLPRLTKLGKSYLERLQLAFDTLKYESQRPYIAGAEPLPATAQAGFAGVDPLLLTVGVFGTGILAGTMFSDYNDAFRKAQTSSSCGSGCGDCSSSSCSSDSGSSCGGSSCGSGCGGCGGGD